MQHVCVKTYTFVSKSNSRLFKVSIISALVNPNIDERLDDVEGDP
jgi:hypothetical protein